MDPRRTEGEGQKQGLLSRVPLFPYLIPIYAIGFLLVHNSGAVDVQYAIPPVVGSFIVSGLLHLGLYRALGDHARAAWVSALLLFAFFTFGHFFQFVTSGFDTMTKPPWFLRQRVLFPAWIGGTLVGCALVIRRLQPQRADFSIPNLALSGLVLWLAFQGAVLGKGTQQGPAHLSPVGRAATQISRRPNIYFIVLDGYGRQDHLLATGRGDIRDFRSSLEKRGFRTAEKARSSYLQTYLSLSTTLNLAYADDLAPAGTLESKRAWLERGPIINQLIQESRVAKFLKGLGYRYLVLPSQVSMSHRSRIADINYGSPMAMTEFGTLLWSSTAASPFLTTQSALITRDDFEETFQHFSEAAKEAGPKFVFSHILLPHPPYIYRADGTPSPPSAAGVHLWADARGYAGQLEYLNRRMIQVVDTILSQDPDAVIVLAGDHGPALHDIRTDVPYRFEDPEELRVRSGILLAIRAPKEIREKLRADMRSINLFRFILRELFQAHTPDLPEATYRVPRSRSQPYDRVLDDGTVVSGGD